MAGPNLTPAQKAKLMARRYVVGVGTGYKETGGRVTKDLAIHVLVTKKMSRLQLREEDVVPRTVGPYRTDVIEIGDLKLYATRAAANPLAARQRPAFPGCSIAHYKVTAGTFGAVVADSRTGQRLILSNNHVLANMTNGHDGRAEQGDPVLQPGPYDAGKAPDDVIARLARFVPLCRTGEPAHTGRLRWASTAAKKLISLARRENEQASGGRGANLVDAAVARPVKPGMIKPCAPVYGRVRSLRRPQPGMRVQKVGRSSGYTTGRIRTVQATLTISLGEVGEGLFTGQVVTTPMAKPGDSGSLIVDRRAHALCLLSAGSASATVASEASYISRLLDVHF